MLCSSSIFVVLLLQVILLQIVQHDLAATVDAFVLVEQRTFQKQQQQQQQQHRQENIFYRRHNEESALPMMISLTDLIESTSSSTITTSLIGESLAIGNIVTATLLFGAGVAATLKRSEESSTDDKALKDLLKKDDTVTKVGIKTDEDSTVEVLQIEEQEEIVVEPIEVKNQSTETPLETKVVKDLMVEVKKEESTSSSVTQQDWKQLKKDVTEEVETVRKELASPTIVKELEKDITKLKTEIGNTFEETKTTKSAGIKRGSTSVVSKEDIKDIKDQVQESLNVASGGKKQTKRRFIVKLVKKIIMPWKAWKNL